MNSIEIKELILNYCYPVGSLYWSAKKTSPAEILGGVWKQVKDKFILAAGDSYAGGSEGGEATHTLTFAEMPNHNHNVGIWNQNHTKYAAVDATGTGYSATSSGGYISTITWSNVAFQTAGRVSSTAEYGSGDPMGTTDLQGGGEAHNNMPPYVVYYCWERTE